MIVEELIDNTLTELGDSEGITWSRNEVLYALKESLQITNCLGYLNRKSVVFKIPTEKSFVNLLEVPELSEYIGYSKRVSELKVELDRHLLEDEQSSATINAEVFDRSYYDELIQRKVDEFLLETGLILTRDLLEMYSPPTTELKFSADLLNVRRLASLWEGNYYPIRRDSEDNISSFFSLGSIDSSSHGQFYSMTTSGRNIARFYPAIDSISELEVVSIKSPTIGEYLPIPCNLSWIIKYGVLYEYFSQHGEGYDEKRAKYCKDRWEQGIRIGKNYTLILNGRIIGLPIRFDDVYELDKFNSNWQNQEVTTVLDITNLNTIAVMSWNLIALPYKLDSSLAINAQIDILANTTLPESENDEIDIPTEYIQTVLMYVQHYLQLKIGSDVFYSSIEKLNRMFEAIIKENARINIPNNEFFIVSYKKSRQLRHAPIELEGQEIPV